MTARPHHLRLVVANDDVACSQGAVRLAWSSPAPSPAAFDARGALLAEAARTVLPPPPARGLVATGLVPASTAAEGVVEESSTRGSLWLGGEQLGLLEDLALIRRSRAFAASGGPAARVCEATPLRGAAYVERLVRGGAVAFGPRALAAPTPARADLLRRPFWRRSLAAALMATTLAAMAFVRRKISFF